MNPTRSHLHSTTIWNNHSGNFRQHRILRTQNTIFKLSQQESSYVGIVLAMQCEGRIDVSGEILEFTNVGDGNIVV
jgi:hypothetical protein